MYVWEPHRSVTATGTVVQWKFYARRTGTIYLQVLGSIQLYFSYTFFVYNTRIMAMLDHWPLSW